jgi:hydrogenase nickel incorporation protein HypB
MVLSKSDLLQYLPEFSPPKAENCLRRLASFAPVIRLSAKTGEGVDAWIDWLLSELTTYRSLLDAGQSLIPRVDHEGRKLHIDAADYTFRPGSAVR